MWVRSQRSTTTTSARSRRSAWAPYPLLVPQANDDGLMIGGVRHPFVSVPLATNAGWNVRKAGLRRRRPVHGHRSERAVRGNSSVSESSAKIHAARSKSAMHPRTRTSKR